MFQKETFKILKPIMKENNITKEKEGIYDLFNLTTKPYDRVEYNDLNEKSQEFMRNLIFKINESFQNKLFDYEKIEIKLYDDRIFKEYYDKEHIICNGSNLIIDFIDIRKNNKPLSSAYFRFDMNGDCEFVDIIEYA